MPFPEVERVVYSRNPLDQVITQFQFPPILRIDAATPADFQEHVRELFPDYSERTEVNFQLPTDLNLEGSGPVTIQLPQTVATKNHQFASEDGNWKINLTRTFLALSTRDYSRWDDFRQKLAVPMEAAAEYYPATYYSRVGLRYINIICQSMIGLQGRPWTELIQPYVLGILASPEVGQNIGKFQSRFEVQLSDGESLARIRTNFVQSNETGETCYKLDNDLFLRRKIDPGEADDKLEYLHDRSRRLFRWSITELLHEALEPTKVENSNQ